MHLCIGMCTYIAPRQVQILTHCITVYLLSSSHLLRRNLSKSGSIPCCGRERIKARWLHLKLSFRKSRSVHPSYSHNFAINLSSAPRKVLSFHPKLSKSWRISKNLWRCVIKWQRSSDVSLRLTLGGMYHTAAIKFLTNASHPLWRM